MRVLTFAYAPLFDIVMSTVAYISLGLLVVLFFQTRSLRKALVELQGKMNHQQAPASPVMADSADNMSVAVEQWARTTPRNGSFGDEPTRLQDQRREAPESKSAHPRRVAAHGELDRVRPDASHFAPHPSSWIVRNQADSAQGEVRPITGGVFTGGNGKQQDRAQVELHPVPYTGAPPAWYSYAILCDGVGGTGDGARAADTAISTFSTTVKQQLAGRPAPSRSTDLEHISEVLWAGVTSAHAATRELSKNPLWRGSATTLDAALVFFTPELGTIAMVSHVGDGAIWTLNERGLHRQVAPEATPEPQALGADQELKGEVRRLSLPPGTRLLLTSDGFEAGLGRGRRASGTETIATVSSLATTLLRSGASSTHIAHCLGGLAASSPDDVTVVALG